ncbi:unnamed protein product [Strongylus vulgaris]|uniref:Uncharacterized protein n=1 Tax=Strongylus vulgaris TaxID=40348 RepID=A0A3P7HZV6_STRVU|nr:unnamed protein product [Strongylus vulgaris]
MLQNLMKESVFVSTMEHVPFHTSTVDVVPTFGKISIWRKDCGFTFPEYDLRFGTFSADLSDEIKDGRNALNIAVHTLIGQERWKIVPLAEWAKSFVVEMINQGIVMDRKRMEAIFFACVGQLEYIGIIRASSATKFASVTVVYHLLNLPVRPVEL